MPYFSHSRSLSELKMLSLDVRIQRCMHLDVLQSPDRPVPMTPTVARGGSPSGFAKVADRGKGLEIGIGIGGSKGGREGMRGRENRNRNLAGEEAGTVKSLE